MIAACVAQVSVMSTSACGSGDNAACLWHTEYGWSDLPVLVPGSNTSCSAVVWGLRAAEQNACVRSAVVEKLPYFSALIQRTDKRLPKPYKDEECCISFNLSADSGPVYGCLFDDTEQVFEHPLGRGRYVCFEQVAGIRGQ